MGSCNVEKVVVIGSGPAGLMAAAVAAGSGRRVTLLEALPSPGRKLLASGSGKCNFTNMLDAESMAERFAPEQRKFVRPALLGFTPQMTRDFFARHGVNWVLVDDFYCFPASGKASDILDVLLDRAVKNGVKIICSAQVTALAAAGGRINAVIAGNDRFECDYVIAAGGGPGFPLLGGRGSLDKAAGEAGISMNRRTQALCGIKSPDVYMAALTGIVLENSRLILDKRNSSEGTLLFTGGGISGPAALDISGRVARCLAEKNPVVLQMDFLPGMDRNAWQKRIDSARKNNGKRLIRNSLGNDLPQAVIAALIDAAGAGDACAAQLGKGVCERILDNLTAYKLSVSAVESWEKSMASTGGVCRSKINSRTMQSKELENLYFAGEFIDADGPCGGYNIQWALSSGYLAGLLRK